MMQHARTLLAMTPANGASMLERHRTSNAEAISRAVAGLGPQLLKAFSLRGPVADNNMAPSLGPTHDYAPSFPAPRPH